MGIDYLYIFLGELGVPFSLDGEEASCMQKIIGSWVCIKWLTPGQ
jgi:hypothetical protein